MKRPKGTIDPAPYVERGLERLHSKIATREALDKIVDLALAYRPPARTKKAKKRQRKRRKMRKS